MSVSPGCQSCPLQCQIKERISNERKQIAVAEHALSALATTLEYHQISTMLHLTALDVVQELQPALTEDAEAVKQLFADQDMLNARYIALRAQPFQEQVTWSLRIVDDLERTGRALAEQCLGPRSVLLSGVHFLDGNPHYEEKCTGATPDVVRLLMGQI